MLRSAVAMAGSAAAHQAVYSAGSMAQQADSERAQRDSASAAEARMQRADHARSAGQSNSGGTGGEARRRVACAWRESRDALFPTGVARSRQARRARTARLPAG